MILTPEPIMCAFMAAGDEHYMIRFDMKAEGEDAEVMVYSEISHYKFFGDETTANDFDKAIKEAVKGGAKKLNIRINSPGGDVWTAVAMRSMVINAGFREVRVMIEGLCASAATLFATIPGANVVIAEGSDFMIHNPAMWAYGNAQALEKAIETLRKSEDQFQDLYASKTGQDKEKIKGWMDDTTWFTAKEAVEIGFCDELLATGKLAACLTPRDLELMKSIYRSVPEQVSALVAETGTRKPGGGDRADPGEAEEKTGGEPEEGGNGEKEGSQMELDKITAEDLKGGNPALYDQIRQDAVNQERERMDEIDALTMPGYEDLAEAAKANGTSAAEFHKQIVAAMKEKGKDFLDARQRETAPAAGVAGGEPDTTAETEAKEMKENAEDIAEYAKAYSTRGGDGMY